MTVHTATPVVRALLHPVVLGSIALLVLNDHVLKLAWPGVVTGKLSDFAGLVFLPVVVAYVAGGRSARAVMLAAVAVGIAFAAVKTSQAACDGYAATLGFVQWIAAVPSWLARQMPLPSPPAATVMRDPTDLVALPFLAVGVAIATAKTKEGRLVAAAKESTHCAPAQATHIGSS